MVSYKPSMFIWINRSLGLPYMEQVAVRKVGESDTFKLFGLLWWFRQLLHVDDVGERGPFLSLLFIVSIPLWELRDPLVSSLHGPGQILV